MNREFPDIKAGFRKGRGTREQIANICWTIEKAREFQNTSNSTSLTVLKPLCGSPQTVENSSRDGNSRPPYLTSEKPLCRSGRKNLHQTTDWFKIGKGVSQSCILSP